ncbi:unnamed protein product [Adineta ricciae]|uniref:Uncharacterized protein n=1 Tax=Adineta ricciae TaxID=249248 RepID=A0A814LQ36_ADIRI|nr:unnamed protein product [Adineta ricciae]CAF1068110.1 unnamed protein product [Adineta ricciae]
MSIENDKTLPTPTVLHFKKPDSSSTHHEITTTPPPITTDSSVDHEDNVESTNDDEKPITTVSHSRRVHFPTEDSQLRMISYASEPHSKQPLLSLGVILQRYRATCQRLQIRPMNTILDQLSMMDDGRKSFVDRLDCLKIANEKIDLKSVDAIEEILSRCRFHTLSFESSVIDDAALTQLFEVIEYYESCTHIILSNQRAIGVQGYQALTKYLRKTNSLERLDMNSTRFDDNTIINFTRSLRLSSTLYELHVESCQLNGKLLQKFIQNIRSCGSLRELYLCDNRLQVQDSLLINELLRTCGSFLTLLDMRSNSLHDSGMSHLASQLSHYDENHKHESSLQKISVQANQLTQQGVGFLAKSLLHNRTIRSLNLSQNNIGNEGLFLLRDALLTNRTINELILRNCHLTDQAAIALAEFIAESSTIEYVDLRENNIQASGICGMAIAIKNNKSLLKLDFDPIVSTPTNLSAMSLNNNNIDRTTTSNSLLSLANLRRMTTGFGSFASNTPSQSSLSGGGTRELLEQKARWMNDISAVCQRNILIYEEKLRLQEESTPNGEVRNNSNVIKPEDIQLDENNSSIDADIPTDNSTNTAEQVATGSNDNNQETVISTSTPVKNPSVEQTTIIPNDADYYEVEQTLMDLIESVVNGEIDESNQNSTFRESSSNSDLIDDFVPDDKRKIHHSDSLYLLRKKVKNENDDNTSDDESQLSLSEP